MNQLICTKGEFHPISVAVIHFRLKKGITAAALSRISMVSSGIIKRIERGETEGSKHLVRIAEALDIETKELTSLPLTVVPLKKQTRSSLCEYSKELSKEFCLELNYPLTPDKIGHGSAKKVWWSCSKCAHKWKVSPNTRTSNGSGCPRCSKVPRGPRVNIAAGAPELSLQYDLEKNSLPISRVYLTSRREVWWKCPACHNSWKDSPHRRLTVVKAKGCPRCSGGTPE